MASGRLVHRVNLQRFLTRRTFLRAPAGLSASIDRATSISVMRMLSKNASLKFTKEAWKEEVRFSLVVTGESRTVKKRKRSSVTSTPLCAGRMDHYTYATTSAYAESRQTEQSRR